MNVGKCLGIGGVAALPVLCCAGSSLLVGLGSAALSGWLATVGYVLAPIALVVAAAAMVLYRRQRSTVAADERCGAAEPARGLPS